LLLPFNNPDTVDGAEACNGTILEEFCETRAECEAFSRDNQYRAESLTEALADPNRNVPTTIRVTNLVKVRVLSGRTRKFKLNFDIENVPNSPFKKSGDITNDWSLGFNDGIEATLSWALWLESSTSSHCGVVSQFDNTSTFATPPAREFLLPYLDETRTDAFHGAFVQLQTYDDIPTTSPTGIPTKIIPVSQNTSSDWEDALVVVGVVAGIAALAFVFWKCSFNYSRVTRPRATEDDALISVIV